MFGIYLKLGFDHILDVHAYDHILFVMTLCAVYVLKDWKKVLWLVTAFTLGHSLTLALSVLHIVNVPASWIEKLIPVTIMLTALYNLRSAGKNLQSMYVLYAMAGFFGLIHGLGFSNYLRALLGDQEDLLVPLLGFNLGVEAGQVHIVIAAMALNLIWVRLLRMDNKYWVYLISVVSFIVSFYLLVKQYQ
ncbi:MAG: HupE/UreJ family protein [Saprospiraceae bacterium]|nr:HupE/UreJ family protein [Saprospiraceae bacterium]